MFDFWKKEVAVADTNIKVEERAVTAASIDSIFSSGYSSSTATNITTAYACIRLLSNTVAMTSLKHFETTIRGEEELKTSRLTALLKSPQNNTTYFQWMQNMTNQLITKGNGFSMIIRENGSPIEFIYVPEESVQIYTTLDILNPYYYFVSAYGQSWKLAPEDMIHFRNITEDGFTGLDPLTLHQITFDAAASINDYNKTYMDNATNVRGIISTDKKLNAKTVEDLQQAFGRKFGGTANSGKTPILSEGMKYEQLKVISPIDTDYIANRGLNKADIAEIYGVPLAMLGTTDSTYSNAEQHALMYQRYTINPMYEMISQELETKLIPRHSKSKQSFAFVPDNLKLASSKEKAETVSLLKNTGIITPNEGREFYGLPKVPGADELVNDEAKETNQQAPKTVGEDNNAPAGAPITDAIAAKTTRSIGTVEDIDIEIQRLKSLRGRM